jgi:hypothetical protein
MQSQGSSIGTRAVARPDVILGTRSALHGDHRTDVAQRQAQAPWYTTKTRPAYHDMIIKLRRVTGGRTPNESHTLMPWTAEKRLNC